LTWNIPLTERLDIGVNLARRGYPPAGIAANIADRHYMGRGRPQAAAHLTKQIFSAWYAANGGQTEAQEEIGRKANTLKREGWRPIFDDRGRCFFIHSSGVTVNRQGGSFTDFNQAVEYTFNSATREVLTDVVSR